MHIQPCTSAVHHVHKILLRRRAEDTSKLESFVLVLSAPKSRGDTALCELKKIRVPATFTIGFLDAIRMVGLRSAQPANGRIRPLAPIFMPRYASRAPMGHLHLVTQVLCFQQRHLFADRTKVMRKLCSEAQKGCSFAGVRCVFVCRFLLLQTANAGLCVAAVVRTALRHVNDLVSRGCGACGALRARRIAFAETEFWLLSVAFRR